MKATEKEYRQVRKAARQAYREAQKALEEQQRQINAQQHQLREEFKKRMGALHDMYNQPTEHSHIKNRRKAVFNLQRTFGGIFKGFKTGTLDTENVQMSFDMQDDLKQVQFTITVPYRDFVPDENQG